MLRRFGYVRVRLREREESVLWRCVGVGKGVLWVSGCEEREESVVEMCV